MKKALLCALLALLLPFAAPKPMQELTFGGFTVMLPEEYAYNAQFGVYASETTQVRFYNKEVPDLSSEADHLKFDSSFATLVYSDPNPQLIQTSPFIAFMVKDIGASHCVVLILSQGSDFLHIEIFPNRVTSVAGADFERVARQILANTVYSDTP